YRTAQLHHGHRFYRECPRRGSAERHGHVRPDQRQLLIEPPATGADLPGIGLGMHAPRAAGLALEALDRIGDVGLLPVDATIFQDGVEQSPGWPDERPPLDVLPVSRLLADEDHPRPAPALAEHGLSGVFIEVAARAALRFLAQSFEGPLPVLLPCAHRQSRGCQR